MFSCFSETCKFLCQTEIQLNREKELQSKHIWFKAILIAPHFYMNIFLPFRQYKLLHFFFTLVTRLVYMTKDFNFQIIPNFFFQQFHDNSYFLILINIIISPHKSPAQLRYFAQNLELGWGKVRNKAWTNLIHCTRFSGRAILSAHPIRCKHVYKIRVGAR